MTEPHQDGLYLHDRATRGEPLSAAEQARLHRWYGEQDRAEVESLTGPGGARQSDGLQSEIDATLTRILAETRRIRALEEQNARLRRELSTLRRRVAQHSSQQPV